MLLFGPDQVVHVRLKPNSACLLQVPNPTDQQAMDTNRCVSDCPKGNGSAGDLEKYSSCRTGCIEKYYFKPGVGTPENNDGNNSGDNNGSNGNGNGNGNANSANGDNNNSGGSNGSGNGNNNNNNWPWDSTNPSSTNGLNGLGSDGTPTDKVDSDHTAGATGSHTATADGAGLVSTSAAFFAIVAALFSL